MKKELIKRALLGFPMGIALGHVISVVVSLFWGNGYYAPCVPSFVEAVGGELNAIILQTVLCGIVGAVFAGASVVWNIESWSILKQTAVYFSAATIVMLPTAYVLGWMERTLFGFLFYFGIFCIYFFAIWLVQYLVWRRKIKALNSKINEMKN